MLSQKNKKNNQPTNQPNKTKQNKQTSYYHWISLSWSCLEAAPTITATFAMDGRQMPTTTTFKAAELWGENPAKMVRWQNILNGMVMFAQRIHCPKKMDLHVAHLKGNYETLAKHMVQWEIISHWFWKKQEWRLLLVWDPSSTTPCDGALLPTFIGYDTGR